MAVFLAVGILSSIVLAVGLLMMKARAHLLPGALTRNGSLEYRCAPAWLRLLFAGAAVAVVWAAVLLVAPSTPSIAPEQPPVRVAPPLGCWPP